MSAKGLRQSIHITLRGRYNITYTGTLILNDNLTSQIGLDDGPATNSSTGGQKPYDQTGASYYVIAVVLVYGMSIVALIASHINRRHAKITEDKQINKYLQDFQIIKEVHARDTYRDLKKSVMDKINWDKKRETHRNLQQSILPLLAIGMQVGTRPSSTGNSIESLAEGPPGKGKRKVYPFTIRRHSEGHEPNDHTGLLETLGARSNRLQLPHESYIEQESLTVPNVYSASNVPHDSSGTRRLRFSRDSSTMLDRSLNSIAEGEEEEKDSQEIHGHHRASVTSLPENTYANYVVPRPSRSRRLGVIDSPVATISKEVERSSLRLPSKLIPSSSTPAIVVSDDSWMVEMDGFNHDTKLYGGQVGSPVSAHSLTVTFEEDRPVSRLSRAASRKDQHTSSTRTARSTTNPKGNPVFNPVRSPNSGRKLRSKSPPPTDSGRHHLNAEVAIQEANPLQITCV